MQNLRQRLSFDGQTIAFHASNQSQALSEFTMDEALFGTANQGLRQVHKNPATKDGGTSRLKPLERNSGDFIYYPETYS